VQIKTERELRESDTIGLGFDDLKPGLSMIRSKDSKVGPMEPYYEFRFLRVSANIINNAMQSVYLLVTFTYLLL